MTAGNDPMRQQRWATIISYKCVLKVLYSKDCPSSTGTSPVLDQALI